MKSLAMGEKEFERALIIGGTGMLAKASAYVASISGTTLLAARNPHRLANEIDAVPLKLDWSNAEAVKILVAQNMKFNMVISWVHSDGLWLTEHLGKILVKGARFIRVLGSNVTKRNTAVHQQSVISSDITRQTVKLGWVNTHSGRRWLSHGEISDAVICAVQNQSRSISTAGTLENH